MTSKAACAIYTRKSSEEGLEQTFNSLDAQREACLAYIQSQKHEGWIACKEPYDDGGFSGGNMDRPGLKKLLADIQAGKIATVVVYKVDRLTRSLSDFAKIIEIFDRHKVSFVSVTQQFNTTTSMGRLTLNVLLSFAQFERELTGERIRDKVAASKKKGMWMGGVIPIGYDRVDRKLAINQADAETVREIFRQYLRLGCVSKLKSYLDANQIRSKMRVSASGRTFGGALYSRGALYHVLKNRIYIGQIVHGGQCYPGQHEPIIQKSVWDQVAALLEANHHARSKSRSGSSPTLLKGLLRDVNGVPFTPTHSLKKGRRYRYYTSQAVIHRRSHGPALPRIPAPELEAVVTREIQGLLGSLDKYLSDDQPDLTREEVVRRAKAMAQGWSKSSSSDSSQFIRDVLQSVIIGEQTLVVNVDKTRLLAKLLGQPPAPSTEEEHETITLTTTFKIISRRGRAHIFMSENPEPKPVPSLVRAVARAYSWYEQILSGDVRTIEELAVRLDVSSAYIHRHIPCASLSPKVIDAILTGRHRPSLTLAGLLHQLSSKWQEQERALLLSAAT